MIDLAIRIEKIIEQTIKEKVPSVFVQSDPAALTADDYEMKTSDGFTLIAFLLAPRVEQDRSYRNTITLQFLIAFGYKSLDGPNGLRSRMNDVYYAIRGIQVAPMRHPLSPVAIRPIGLNESGVWRGDLIMETKVLDNSNTTNAA